ncbi:hypothetical protein AKO1_014348 [Acrasis kona]|uniref:Methyltransferase-like protein 5 n=1 Tax=Acrasis kona TaxID=1008807 RepID=A0AAW2YYU2_9EUKA
MLAIGCAILGASRVTGIDVDPDALDVAKHNIMECGVHDTIDLIQIDAQSFEDTIKARLIKKETDNEGLNSNFKKKHPKNMFDTVVLNPPFGTRIKGADMQFLKIATELTNKAVYSLHKTSTREFVTTKATQWGFSVEVVAELKYDLEKSMSFHKKVSKPIEVDLIRLTRISMNKRIKNANEPGVSRDLSSQKLQAKRVVVKTEKKRSMFK